MKIDQKAFANILATGTGELQITIDNIEDFWTLANVIHVGDCIRSQIRRKVKNISSTGKSEARQVITKAVVKITEIDYQSGVNEMNLRGTLTHEVEDARVGAPQRILLEQGRPFSIIKERWDQFSIDQIREASDPVSDATVAAVMMQSGLANICIVGRNSTVICRKVQKAIPKVKAHGSSGKNMEAKLKFFQMTAEALVNDIKIDDMKCIIIASPGFLQSEFLAYLRNNQSNTLSQPEMQKHVQTLKATVQANAMNQLLKEMNKNMDMIALGQKNVQKCYEETAIKTLLVTDSYIKSLPLEERLSFLQMKENLEKNQTEVVIFSTKHQSGTQLNDLGGICSSVKILQWQEQDTEFDDGLDD
ncbi:protein pelota [Histomonas meleagridis]|uniref:protein pelota n=1 Tax=Histomonas meleagridis TaxID=135588 RepID=UPI00355AB99F|nr:protein pelota [Histomonas meleagridis]